MKQILSYPVYYTVKYTNQKEKVIFIKSVGTILHYSFCEIETLEGGVLSFGVRLVLFL